ncbi:DNA cytosine methyltransferase [Metabacillus sp. cB07]|uniref:DNA cytosine methyltransferase n=1 Tax=Metabacillus sp. cB07 TaxID=2806989 RepID=UPI001939C5F7|nr:DNA cytosine methyltransferase [Metabacillus sp. cB07]
MSSYSKIKIIDLFAGAGGLSNGFEQTGRFEVAGAIEINEAAAKTYINNHKNGKDIIIRDPETGKSDISKIDFAKLIADRKLDINNLVVIGGPPCQGFSNANRQKNYLISGNNQLIKEYVRAIKEIRPKAFLMENVKTINSKTHKFFVTEHIENSIFEFSSEKHLSEISSGHCLWESDVIDILETEHSCLLSQFERVNSKKEITPFISQTTALSRMKKILKRSKSSQSIFLINIKEKKDTELLLDMLENRVNEVIIPSSIKENAISALTGLLRGPVQGSIFASNLEPLIDLNTYLFHMKELREEKIVIEEIRCDSSKAGKLIMRAHVKSYNIVDYLVNTFRYLGYSIDKGILTATHFGVPQKRNRFMMLGVKKAFLESDKVFLPEKIDTVDNAFNTRDAIYDLEDIAPNYEVSDEPIIYNPKPNKMSALQKYYRSTHNSNLYNHVNTKSRDLSIKRFEAIKQSNGKNFHNLTDEMKTTYANTDRTQNTIYLRLNYDEPSPTVVNVRKSMWNHPKNAVSISIREAARLQSFKDDFVFMGSKDQQYQQVGNAVPPLMARAVAETMLLQMNDYPVMSINDEFNKHLINVEKELLKS